MNRRIATQACAVLLTLLASIADAQEYNPISPPPTVRSSAEPRVLIRLRSAPIANRVRALAAEDRVAVLASRTGSAIRSARPLGSRLHIVELEPGASVAEELERFRADPEVAYAEPDRRRYAHAVPSDPLFAQQWYWQSLNTSATASEQAWDTTTGSAGVVVAVLDTGVRFDHPDLGRAEDGGRLLPGYDFVTNVQVANDGDGRDPDPSDPGDYVTQSDLSLPGFSDCRVANSSWHGTRVAGIIGARSNDAAGLAGGTWAGWILPVRVLGKCGGVDSDILLAMLWAAGVHVEGIPDNPYPAQVVNMSLGSSGECTPVYRDVIAELAERGTLVVVSAGNAGGPVEAPANCDGVVAVAGLRHAGTKVGYSSLGPEVALSAPAGNCVNTAPGSPCLFSIMTTVNLGTTTPGTNGHTDATRANYGTSFSAPIVSAIAALMLSVNGNLDAADLRARLMEGAALPFPVSPETLVPQCLVPTGPTHIQAFECNCTQQTCGAGMAHAPGAVLAAQRPIAAIAAPASFGPGANVMLSAAGSAAACGRTIATYNWAITDATGVGIVNPDSVEATVVAPAVDAFTVRLTVTDDLGRSDVADIRVEPTGTTTAARASAGQQACRAAVAPPSPPPPSPPAPPASSGGGGGGATGLGLIAVLTLSVVVRRRLRGGA